MYQSSTDRISESKPCFSWLLWSLLQTKKLQNLNLPSLVYPAAEPPQSYPVVLFTGTHVKWTNRTTVLPTVPKASKGNLRSVRGETPHRLKPGRNQIPLHFIGKRFIQTVSVLLKMGLISVYRELYVSLEKNVFIVRLNTSYYFVLIQKFSPFLCNINKVSPTTQTVSTTNVWFQKLLWSGGVCMADGIIELCRVGWRPSTSSITQWWTWEASPWQVGRTGGGGGYKWG